MPVRWRSAAMAAAAVLSMLSPAFLARAAVAAPATSLPALRADIVVDAGTGRVLVCDNDHTAFHPASTAKIMTALVAVERLAPNAFVTADPNTNAIPENKIGFPPSSRWPLDEMLASMMMVSANDAAYAIAHTVGGNLDNFAAILNRTARRYGMKDTILGDPSGLDNWASYKGGPYISAYDLAIAARNAHAIPAIAKWSATWTYSFTDPAGVTHHFTNHNKMLAGGGYEYPGADGFKTGYTDRAQHTLVASATRSGRTLIAVILGAADGGYTEAARLLDTGFASNGTGLDGKPACGGETLPPDRVSLYSDRASDRDGFSHLTRAAAPAAPAPTVAPAAPIPQSFVLNQAPRAATRTNTVVTAPRHGHSLLSVRNVVIVLVLLAVALFVLRRRAVKRRRALRLARRRQRMAAIRSGGLPVVDGRYRSGLRMGPPVESHVRIRRAE